VRVSSATWVIISGEPAAGFRVSTNGWQSNGVLCSVVSFVR
jgi:hypothetical protein